jgi:hypothetical protein
MKTTTKVIFASALLLAAVAPTLSHASYFVDQTKTWALEARAQDQMGKVTRHDTAKPQVSKDQAFGVGNTSVPGIGINKDDSQNQKSK